MNLPRHLGWLGAAALCLVSVWATVPEAATKPERLSCRANVSHCFAITVYASSARLQGLDRFLRRHVAHANKHFAKIGVGFVLRPTIRLPAAHRHLRTRGDRDALVKRTARDGSISLFLVDRLDNVDEPGEIRGVHWRYRADRRRRAVILSTKARTWVLTHELGHFFGLPHSRFDISLMNKRRRKRPISKRTFAPSEYKKMARRRDQMLRNRRLVVIKPR